MNDLIAKYRRALGLYRDDGISVPILPSELRGLLDEIERLGHDRDAMADLYRQACDERDDSRRELRRRAFGTTPDQPAAALYPGCTENDTGYHRPDLAGFCSDCNQFIAADKSKLIVDSPTAKGG